MPHDPAGNGSGNSRNGHTAKKVQSKDGELDLEIPRDRNGSIRNSLKYVTWKDCKRVAAEAALSAFAEH